jgi:2-oxoglutarate dehydrogenase complex dehydrogenase (E1) component-like enzyme
LLVWLVLWLTGCGEPSVRELKNRRELEALLTAISLKNQKELDKDIQRIEDRHASGELSDGSYKDLREIIEKAQRRDWAGAEKQAYEMRESKPFFQ